jgi:hypothetical protein
LKKKTLSIVYGIAIALILAGVVLNLVMGISFGKLLIFLTIIFMSTYQGWMISKLHKQLEIKKNQ